jgi:hypothetical protein
MKQYYYDTESGRVVDICTLREEFTEMQNDDPDTYDYSFELYLANCLSKNGTLVECN